MKITLNYRILKRITKDSRKELEAVEYGRLVGAWEWGGKFSEIARRSGVTESRVRDTINRYKETGSLTSRETWKTPKGNNHSKKSYANINSSYTDGYVQGSLEVCNDM